MSKKEIEQVKDGSLEVVEKSYDKKRGCLKILSLTCYGGLASLLIAYYTDAVESHETEDDRLRFFINRFLTGCFIFPASRLVLQLSYILVMRQQMNSVIVSGLSGGFCGLLFGVRGTMPDAIVSAVGFAVGAMLTDHFS